MPEPPMHTLDERSVRAPLETIYDLARDIERWPEHLVHYRYVRFLERTPDGGGLVEMSADRPFGFLRWPTWWASRMSIVCDAQGLPVIHYEHVEGVTTGMNVAWTFQPQDNRRTHVRIVHEWTGPRWPLVSRPMANYVIGPVFVHGIASRTLHGLAIAAERRTP